MLYIGGTGEISMSCVKASVLCGHHVTVLNRGKTKQGLPAGAMHVTGDLSEPEPYASLANQYFDVVCQFLVFTPTAMARDIEFSLNGAVNTSLFPALRLINKKKPAV